MIKYITNEYSSNKNKNEDVFINIRHNTLSNIGPWPDLLQQTSFHNSGIEESWGW